MTKFIFLDIDGVLATKESYNLMLACQGKSYPSFDIKCVETLNHIIKDTEAKIVISSTWRKLYKFNLLKVILKQEGVVGEVIGHTPMTLSHRVRGEEIREYLASNTCDRFVILDDDVWDITSYEDLKEYIIHIEEGFTRGGLIPKYTRKAIDILNSTNKDRIV